MAVDALLIGTVSRSGLNDLLAPQLDHRLVLGVVNDIDLQVVRAHRRALVPARLDDRPLAGRTPSAGGPRADRVDSRTGGRGLGGLHRPRFPHGHRGQRENVVAERHGDTGGAIQRRLVEAVLDEQPQLDYLVGNAPMAEAAIAELRRRGREGGDGDRVVLPDSGRPAGGILRGRILAAVTDFPVLQGRLAVRQALRALEGGRSSPTSARRSNSWTRARWDVSRCSGCCRQRVSYRWARSHRHCPESL